MFSMKNVVVVPVVAPATILALTEEFSDILSARYETALDEGFENVANQLEGALQDCCDRLDEETGMAFWLSAELDEDGSINGWYVGCPTGARVEIPQADEATAESVAPAVAALVACLTATK